MTKLEYIQQIVDLYAIANAADSDNAESWADPEYTNTICSHYDAILRELLGSQYHVFVESGHDLGVLEYLEKGAANWDMEEYMERMDDVQRLTYSDIEGLVEGDSQWVMLTEYKANRVLSLTDDYSRMLDVEFNDLVDFWLNTSTEAY